MNGLCNKDVTAMQLWFVCREQPLCTYYAAKVRLLPAQGQCSQMTPANIADRSGTGSLPVSC
jgi:hypothetical protein